MFSPPNAAHEPGVGSEADRLQGARSLPVVLSSLELGRNSQSRPSDAAFAKDSKAAVAAESLTAMKDGFDCIEGTAGDLDKMVCAVWARGRLVNAHVALSWAIDLQRGHSRGFCCRHHLFVSGQIHT